MQDSDGPLDERDSIVSDDAMRLAFGRESLQVGSTNEGQSEVPERIGRFVVGERIGQGGMAVVYRAHDPDLERDVAIKLLRHEEARTRRGQLMSQRFEREARLASRLEHPGVVPVHEFGMTSDGRAFLVMRLVRGQTLRALIENHLEKGLVGADELVRAFERLAEVIAYAHTRGLVHGDLKSANVMVGAFGEVQVLDWGFGGELRIADEASDSADATVFGTPEYMAPERARGELSVDARRVDVFGLGAVLCEVLTGCPPFSAHEDRDVMAMARAASLEGAMAGLQAVRPDEPGLVAVAERALAADPSRRFADGSEVACAVRDARSSAEERARVAMRRAASARARALASVAVALLGVVSLGAYAWSLMRIQRLQAQLRAELAAGRVAVAAVELGAARRSLQRATALAGEAADESDEQSLERLAREIIRARLEHEFPSDMLALRKPPLRNPSSTGERLRPAGSGLAKVEDLGPWRAWLEELVGVSIDRFVDVAQGLGPSARGRLRAALDEFALRTIVQEGSTDAFSELLRIIARIEEPDGDGAAARRALRVSWQRGASREVLDQFLSSEGRAPDSRGPLDPETLLLAGNTALAFDHRELARVFAFACRETESDDPWLFWRAAEWFGPGPRGHDLRRRAEQLDARLAPRPRARPGRGPGVFRPR